MPHRYPAEIRRQVIELARSGTRVAQLSATFGMTEATIYNWLHQERVDRGWNPGHQHRHGAGADSRGGGIPGTFKCTGGKLTCHCEC